MKTEKPIAVVLGAGPGLGAALCQKFMDAGYFVVGLNRSQHPMALPETSPKQQVAYKGMQVDLSDAAQVAAVCDDILQTLGVPEVVIHNAAQLVIKPFFETSSAAYQQAWQATSQSLFHVMQALLPAMVDAGRGAVIVSGATASIRGGAKFSAFASAKFALRGLTQSLAREFQPQGIHIAHVLLDGIIDTDRSRELHDLSPANMMTASDIASQYLLLVKQPASTWTHELDLRPSVESF